ncbi:hypothetical protein [Niveispirillum sp.]|uniref:hypothetical protein n=1 Tax=Niveispirillum sp. TaxID=1917217 RepID=UPI001B6217E9|nr:hypothetical protein [Niveispirillum sp.]MBP7339147.1 hypothetical protein [Niveispirillum sp.]
MYVIDGGTPTVGDVQITSSPFVPAEGEVTILPFPMPGDGEITIQPISAEEGEFTILPFPMPGDDGVFTILPFPMPGDGEITIQPISAGEGEFTILPFPMPGDDGVFTILPIFDENFFAIRPLSFDFDFSALAIGTIALPAFDWNNLLPTELVSATGFGFQSFVLNGDGGMTLTLLDGSFVTLAPADLSAISFPAIEDAGRLAVDPSTLTGVLLDGFNAGWI